MDKIKDIGWDTRNEPIPTTWIGLKSAIYSDRLSRHSYIMHMYIVEQVIVNLVKEISKPKDNLILNHMLFMFLLISSDT